MPEKDLWERLVNQKWPADMPTPTDQEAITAFKRLYRHTVGRPWRGDVKITRGNRYSWRYGRTFRVNPNKKRRHEATGRGWRQLVHDLSHYVHMHLAPDDRPHDTRQAYIERDMVDYVLAHGFLDGALKTKTPPKERPDVVKQRYDRMLARRKRWQQKFNRAEKALAKVDREIRDYHRRHPDRLTDLPPPVL